MRYSAEEIKKLANGLWYDIIPALTGVDHHVFTKENKPCPICGGTDRFWFSDRGGDGVWGCRVCGGRDGTGGGGDGLQLIMRINGWNFKQTLDSVGKWLNAPETDFGGVPRYKVPRAEKKEKEQEEWIPLDEQPEEELTQLQKEKVSIWNPKKQKWAKVKPTHVAVIRNESGILKGAVVRFEINGKKIPTQVMWCANKNTGEMKWVIHGLGPSKPLYGAETIGNAPRVVVVQGERKKDIAQNVIGKYPVVSIVGGDSAITSMDLSPLHGKTVLIWPDNDWEGSSKNSGMRCAKRMAEMLHGLADVKIVNPPNQDKPNGWDLGDAFTTDGWTFKEFAEYVQANTTVYGGYNPNDIEFLDDGEDTKDQNAEQEEKPQTKKERQQKKSQPIEHASGDELSAIFNRYMRFLGCHSENSSVNVYYSFMRNQVIELSASAHTKQSLIMLMPEDVWKACFPEKISEGEVVKWSLDAAINYMFRRSESLPKYEPKSVRKGGCWWDSERVVMHMGSHLLVDSEPVAFKDFQTKYIYQSATSLDFDHKLSSDVGELKFIEDVARSFVWRNPASYKFLCGWIVLAPICGLLDWRPHMWISGSSGCGKSTVINDFVAPLLGGIALRPNGSSTEAGIRQNLNGDVVPVVIDEAEGFDQKSREEIQSIIKLARLASCNSTGEISKGQPNGKVVKYLIRSMFAFAAVNQSIKMDQDENRAVLLELSVPTMIMSYERAEKSWRILQTKLANINEILGKKLIIRTLSLANKIVEGMQIVKKAVSKQAENARLGDTYGVLLTGYWFLMHDEPPTEEEADDMAASIDWSAYIDRERNDGSNDADECLSSIMQVQVRGEIGNRPTTCTLGDLTAKVYFRSETQWDSPNYLSDSEVKDIKSILGRYGLKIEEGGLLIANNSEALTKGLRETAYGGGWKTNLQRIKGAKKTKKIAYFAAGIRSRFVEIPWESVPISSQNVNHEE